MDKTNLKPNDKLYTWHNIKLSFVIKTPTNITLTRHDCQRINAELLDMIDQSCRFKNPDTNTILNTNNQRCYMDHGFFEDGIYLIKDNPESVYVTVNKDVIILGYTTYLSANEDEEGKEYYDFEPISGMIDHLDDDLINWLKSLYKIGAYIDINSIKMEIMPFDKYGEEHETL